MTPTDVVGWIATVPFAAAAIAGVLAAAGVLENTQRGRALADRAIRWILR